MHKNLPKYKTNEMSSPSAMFSPECTLMIMIVQLQVKAWAQIKGGKRKWN